MTLLQQFRALPDGAVLSGALDGLDPLYLVGGAVRDLLRGEPPVDIDLAVEGDVVTTAHELAVRLGGEAVEHERFGTATVRSPVAGFDLATCRTETYAAPGALPDVAPASIGADLARRDFTINALALRLNGLEAGAVLDPHGGSADVETGTIRVLHERSFSDDPTRLLRAVRYETRLGGALAQKTESLVRSAAAGSGFSTVSGPRVRDELLDLLGEPGAPRSVERLVELGLLDALHPSLKPDSELVASAQLACSETAAEPELAALAALLLDADRSGLGWLDGLGLRAPVRDRVAGAARDARRLARELAPGASPSAVHGLLDEQPPEALALALALGAPGEAVLRFISDLSHVRLEISGDDLLAAGVPQSPVIGHALAETLRRKLDGEVKGRDEELRAALDAAGVHR